jgi:ATP-dependent exoDNAse (exonuclease V) beta subunit
VRANDGVQLLANHAEGHLEARCTTRVGPAFATQGFDAEREKKLEQAQQLRLLYVAATRAREHLVLCLFHSPRYAKASHAASIWNRVQAMKVRPTEIPLAALEMLPPVAVAAPADALDPSAEDVDPAAHRAAESSWLANRRRLLAALGQQHLATPSGLAHEPEPPDFVDYKTDRVSDRAIALRAAAYAIQGAAYALAVQRATGRKVTRVEFVFAAASVDRAEVFVVSSPDVEGVERLVVERSTGAELESETRRRVSCTTDLNQ